MKKFHPGDIKRLVFDLDSISFNFDEEAWENFRKFIQNNITAYVDVEVYLKHFT